MRNKWRIGNKRQIICSDLYTHTKVDDSDIKQMASEFFEKAYTPRQQHLQLCNLDGKKITKRERLKLKEH